MLTSYNGKTITYDTVCNPLSDGTWTYTWQAGRQLKKMTKSGVTVEFKYDHNGLRTQKKVLQNGVTTTTNYMLNGKLLMHMTVGADKLHFFYDAQNRPTKVSYNSVIYTYLHNLQGDIVGIVDGNGTLVVEYNYDAWGKLLSTIGTKATTLGKLNPFRYRGYIYDEESVLYYLRNRYYNPELQRFISADNIAYLGADNSVISYNLYTYCLNNPANRSDESGNFSLPNWAKVAIGAVATVAAVAVTVATGGVAAPVLASVAVNTIIGGITGYAKGGVDGIKDGLASGFMSGGLIAFGGSLVSAGVRAIKTARQGITIGRNMPRVNNAAGLNGTATYSEGAAWGPLKGRYYNAIKRVFDSKAANSVSCACNKLYIKTMRRLGAVIYDSGLNGALEAGQFYGMELEVVKNYTNLVRMY